MISKMMVVQLSTRLSQIEYIPKWSISIGRYPLSIYIALRDGFLKAPSPLKIPVSFLKRAHIIRIFRVPLQKNLKLKLVVSIAVTKTKFTYDHSLSPPPEA